MKLPADLLPRLWREIRNLIPLFRYLVLQTETHAFCLALSAAALIGFFPSCLVMLSILNKLLGLQWQPQFDAKGRVLTHVLPLSVQVMNQLFEGFFSNVTSSTTGLSDRDFMTRNLLVQFVTFASGSPLVSLLWVLLGAAAVFVPLEAGLNRLWRVQEDRPYWKNQVVGFALTLLGTVLALVFLLVATGLQWLIKMVPVGPLVSVLTFAVNHTTMACLFMAGVLALYTLLPNRKVGVMEVLPAAILAGGLMEVVRMMYFLLAPNLFPQQGPFAISVTFLLLAYFETFVVLGCAFLATERDRYPWLSFIPGSALPPPPPSSPEVPEMPETPETSE